MKRNKGFSLVEMVVVMAISAILVTLVVISMNVVTNSNVQAAARRLETVIRTSRTQCMAKGITEGTLKITNEGGKVYATLGTGSKSLICNSNVDVYVSNTYTDRVGTAFGPGSTASVVFTGMGKPRIDPGQSITTNYLKYIFRRGNRSYEVILYKETGSVVTNMF